MLNIFNNLEPFFEDCYKEISVREYAKLKNISPPTASKLLNQFKDENLLTKEHHKIYHNYKANRDSELFQDLAISYWKQRLSPLIKHLNEELLTPKIILFGSLSKAETTAKSDIDLAIFSVSKKKIQTKPFEKELNRKIEIFTEKTEKSIKNKHLLNNIREGVWIGKNV